MCRCWYSRRLEGAAPTRLVVLKDGVKVDGTELQAELVGKVRNEIGAVACFKQALVRGCLNARARSYVEPSDRQPKAAIYWCLQRLMIQQA